MDTNDAGGGFRPPYLAFQTFWSFLEKLSSRPLPPALDRSSMEGKSGSDQIQLFAALRSFGLIDEHKNVLVTLREFASADDAGRRQILTNWVRTYYPEPMRVSAEHGTEPQLSQAFADSYEMKSTETRRKSMTFFLHAARKAGLELSANFPATRSGSGAPSTPRPKRPKVRTPTPATSNTTNTTLPGESVTVNLGDAGSVTIVANVQWLKLETQTMTDLRKQIDLLIALGTSGPSQEDPS